MECWYNFNKIAKCISGDPEPKEMFEDSDLGKSTLYRSKLKSVQPQHVDPEKTFGVPSVRVDLNRTKSSLADNNVYKLINILELWRRERCLWVIISKSSCF